MYVKTPKSITLRVYTHLVPMLRVGMHTVVPSECEHLQDLGLGINSLSTINISCKTRF